MKTPLKNPALLPAAIVCLLYMVPQQTLAQSQDYTFYTNNGTITITGYIGSGGTVNIPSALNNVPVTYIESYAFNASFRLTSVMIPGSVTQIGRWAFNNCTNLTSVTIGSGLTNIGERAFSSCRSLTNVAIPDSVTLIQTEAFLWCSSLPNITIPKSVRVIMPRVFYQCTSLTAINVETLNAVYSSMDGVLFDKTMASLIRFPEGKGGSYTVPDGVTSIRDQAFQDDTCLGSVTMPNSVTNIGYRAFSDCTSLTNVTIPDSVNTVGDYGFSSCTSLTSAPIPAGVTNIAFGMFSGCTSLTCVTIPNSVTSIGWGAFSDCTSLAAIVIPNSITIIGGSAFSNCTSLASITIPSSVTEIGGLAFSSCDSLTAIKVDPLNPNYSDVGGVLFNKDQTALYQYPVGKAGNYTIPSSVLDIGRVAFADCYGLTGVYFQSDAPSLPLGAFAGATNAILYYLPGTTGWKKTLGGRPTVLWNPLVQTNDPNFGVRSNQFGFNISGTTNITVIVEASTDLTNRIWTPVGTNTLADGTSYFSDPQWTNYSSRFYRLRSP